MADEVFSMTVEGMDELAESLKRLTSKYPDKAGQLLSRNARKLRKEVVDQVKDLTETSASSKMSLAKESSYKISQIKGLGTNQYVEISAKSPHFHLVEHGHVLKNHKGETIGFVQGKHMMDIAVKKKRR